MGVANDAAYVTPFSMDMASQEKTYPSLLHCCVCLEVFIEPKVLPCCHTFCKRCLVKLIGEYSELEAAAPLLQSGQGTDLDDLAREQCLVCPQCRAQHKIASIDGLCTDFALENQIRKEGLAEKKVTTKELNCDSCDGHDTVKKFCKTCLEYLCDECSQSHRRMKRFRGHELTAITEIDPDQQNVSSPSSSKSHHCSVHQSEAIQLYCKSCDKLVCVKCVVNAHKGHNFLEMHSCTQALIDEELTTLTAPVRDLLQSSQSNIEYVTNVEKVTNNMAADLQSTINQVFDSYIATLEARRAMLLAESERKCNSMLKVLWSEKDGLEKTCTELTAVLGFTERLRNCTDTKEFLSLASQALPRLAQLKERTWDDKNVLQVEGCCLDFQVPKGLESEVLSSVGELEETHLPLCRVDLPQMIYCGVEQKVKFVILKRSKNCRPMVDTVPSVNVTNTSRFGHRSVDVVVTSDDSKSHRDTWIATFTPAYTGQHQLTVSLGSTNAHSTTFTTFEVAIRRSKKTKINEFYLSPHFS